MLVLAHHCISSTMLNEYVSERREGNSKNKVLLYLKVNSKNDKSFYQYFM